MVDGEGQRQHVAHHHVAVDDDGGGLGAAHCHDRGFWWVDDGQKAVDSEHPEVADRNHGAFELGWCDRPVPAAADESPDLGRELTDAFGVGGPHDRNQEASRHGHRDADVGTCGSDECVPGELADGIRSFSGRQRDCADDEIVDGRALPLGRPGDEFLAKRDESGHIDVALQIEMWRSGLGLCHPLGDGALQAGQCDPLAGSGRGWPGRWRRL